MIWIHTKMHTFLEWKASFFFKWRSCHSCSSRWWFQIFFFSPPPGEMIKFDKYFSNGLKPPTSLQSFRSRVVLQRFKNGWVAPGGIKCWSQDANLTIQLQAAGEYVNLCYIVSSDYAHSFKGWKYLLEMQKNLESGWYFPIWTSHNYPP